MTAIQDIPLKTIAGKDASLADYAGQVLLVVNVASKCGLTPQYEGLEALYEKYKDEGFTILGFPANNFKEQEPGSNEEIQGFCSTNYGVQFPMFSKISVAGADKHPLYAKLIEDAPNTTSPNGGGMRERLKGYGIETNPEPEVVWNFEKFLVGRDGEVAERFTPDTEPNDPALVKAVERELFASE